MDREQWKAEALRRLAAKMIEAEPPPGFFLIGGDANPQIWRWDSTEGLMRVRFGDDEFEAVWVNYLLRSSATRFATWQDALDGARAQEWLVVPPLWAQFPTLPVQSAARRESIDEIAQMWRQFVVMHLPRRREGEEIAGVTPSSMDAFTSDYVCIFLCWRGCLDVDRINGLQGCVDKLEIMVPLLEGEERTYFEHLLLLSHKVLRYVGRG